MKIGFVDLRLGGRASVTTARSSRPAPVHQPRPSACPGTVNDRSVT
jgi:hypothetical protein